LGDPDEREFVRSISILEERSINTATTMIAVKDMLLERFATKEAVMLHLVSSANHMPRVMRDAAQVFGDMIGVFLSGVPAGTSYGHKSPKDVVIYELGEPKPKV